MNIFFALKGIVVLFLFTLLCRFILAFPLSLVTENIQSLAHNQSASVEAGVGPVLVMISNVFTTISIIFGVSIVILLFAIALGGSSREDDIRY